MNPNRLKPITIIAFFIAIVIFSGCRTTRSQQKETERKNWEDAQSRRVVDIEQRIFELERNIAVNKRQLDSVEQRLIAIENKFAATTGNYKEEVTALRTELNAIRGAADKKMEIIMDEVARENQRILQSIRSNRGSGGYSQGYEHVVKSGETISTIAREYKVSIDSIVNANQLANPDAIRVGQILFIPQ